MIIWIAAAVAFLPLLAVVVKAGGADTWRQAWGHAAMLMAGLSVIFIIFRVVGLGCMIGLGFPSWLACLASVFAAWLAWVALYTLCPAAERQRSKVPPPHHKETP